MSFSRRDWIHAGASAFAALAFLPVPKVLAREASARRRPAGPVSRRDFEARVDESFRILGRGEARGTRLRLRAVEDIPCAGVAGTCGSPDSFTVTFDDGSSNGLPQATYRVASGSLGAFDVFLVPGRSRDGRRTCIATFNRLSA